MIDDGVMLDVMNTILKPVTDVKITIPEKVFVEKYLPLFIDSNKRKLAIDMWLEVCKNPYYSVTVINDKGEPVFVVPPLWAKQKTRMVDDPRYSISEVISIAQKKSSVIPKRGLAFFNECIDYIKTTNLSNEDYHKMWDDIFRRYGYSKEEIIKVKKEKKDIKDNIEDINYHEI